MALWLKNTAGQPSASLTFVTVGFSVVTLWLLVSIVAKMGHVEIRPFSGAEAMSYLTPLLALYFGRRWTDGKSTLDNDPGTATVIPGQEAAAQKATAVAVVATAAPTPETSS